MLQCKRPKLLKKKRVILTSRQLASELARRCKKSGKMDDITNPQASHMLKVLREIVQSKVIPADQVTEIVFGMKMTLELETV
jgi:hypothetical protein